MALLFSAVTASSDTDQAEFLVSGRPSNRSDLECWTAFDNLLSRVDTEQDIRIHVAACLYGEGEAFDAMPEEVAYLSLRAAKDEHFFYDHCTDAGHSDFTIHVTPGELFRMEMK